MSTNKNSGDYELGQAADDADKLDGSPPLKETSAIM